MRAIVKAATAIPEMQFAFECICADDSKSQGREVTPEDYSDEDLVSEAEYRLSTYFEEGHVNNDEMRMGDDPESNKIAQKDIKMLKAFIKKYKTQDSQWSKYTSHLIKYATGGGESPPITKSKANRNRKEIKCHT